MENGVYDMKKGLVLVSGLAIVLAFTQEATAGAFDVKIGGDAYFAAGYVSQSNDAALGGVQRHDFTNRFNLELTPVATADNGMEYGASLRLRSYQHSGLADVQMSYIFADGRLGRVEAGVSGSPNSRYGVIAPFGFGSGGVVGDWGSGNGWIQNQTTYLGSVFDGDFNSITDTNSATRINYFTPRFFALDDGKSHPGQPENGLMAMVSYVPQNLSVGGDVHRVRHISTTGESFCAATQPRIDEALSGCAYKDVVEGDLRYDGRIGEITVATSASYEHGETPSDMTGVSYYPLSVYQFGLTLGYAGFQIGGSFSDAGKSSYARNQGYFLNSQKAWMAGISYEFGSFVVGFNYASGEDAGDVTVPGKRKAALYAFGATYNIAPGLTTSLEYLNSISRNEAGYLRDPFGNDVRGTPVSAGGSGYGSGNAHMILWKNSIAF